MGAVNGMRLLESWGESEYISYVGGMCIIGPESGRWWAEPTRPLVSPARYILVRCPPTIRPNLGWVTKKIHQRDSVSPSFLSHRNCEISVGLKLPYLRVKFFFSMRQ